MATMTYVAEYPADLPHDGNPFLQQRHFLFRRRRCTEDVCDQRIWTEHFGRVERGIRDRNVFLKRWTDVMCQT